MADINNFAVAPQAPATLNVDVYKIEGTLTDSDTQALIADFTGENALTWPTCLNALSEETRAGIIGDLAPEILRLAAGLPR